MAELGPHPLQDDAHVDISAEVLEGLLTIGSVHNFRVGVGIGEDASIDDITWDPLTRRLRLHFDCRVKQPVLYQDTPAPQYKLWLGEAAGQG